MTIFLMPIKKKGGKKTLSTKLWWRLKQIMGNVETPIWEKITLTIPEAADYSGIGEKTLRKAAYDPKCTFSFFVGRKCLIKRKELEKYISKHDAF